MSEAERFVEEEFEGLCFVNLVDFDMLYGHRNDAVGYAAALTEFDRFLLQLDGKRQPLTDFPGEPPFPTIADLAPVEAIYREEYFGFNEEENTFAQWQTLLTERTIVWEENAKLTLVSSTSIVEGGYHDVQLRSATNAK